MASSRPSIAISSTQRSTSLFDGYFHEPQRMTLVRPYFDISSTPRKGFLFDGRFQKLAISAITQALVVAVCYWNVARDLRGRQNSDCLAGRFQPSELPIPFVLMAHFVRIDGSLRSY